MKILFACAIAIVCIPDLVRAQDTGASVGGNVSVLSMDSDTAAAYSAAFNYRFSRVVGLEIEMTYAPSLESRFPGSAVQAQASATSGILGSILPGPAFTNGGGRAVILSNNVRVAIPTTATRLEPFFVAGGGVAAVRHSADFRYTFPPIAGFPGGGPSFQGSQTIAQRVTSSSLGLALTLGGGLGIKATSHLWVDADLRLVRILGEEDQNVGRFGVGVRYRF